MPRWRQPQRKLRRLIFRLRRAGGARELALACRGWEKSQRRRPQACKRIPCKEAPSRLLLCSFVLWVELWGHFGVAQQDAEALQRIEGVARAGDDEQSPDLAQGERRIVRRFDVADWVPVDDQ